MSTGDRRFHAGLLRPVGTVHPPLLRPPATKRYPETHFGIGLDAWDPLFTDELVNESIHLFAKAKKVADNEEILRRVNLAELPILYLKCKREPVKSREDGTFQQFIRTLEKEGIELIAEYRDN